LAPKWAKLGLYVKSGDARTQAAYDYFEARVSGAGERFLDRYFSTWPINH
jgi:hypothetical protein